MTKKGYNSSLYKKKIHLQKSEYKITSSEVLDSTLKGDKVEVIVKYTVGLNDAKAQNIIIESTNSSDTSDLEESEFENLSIQAANPSIINSNAYKSGHNKNLNINFKSNKIGYKKTFSSFNSYKFVTNNYIETDSSEDDIWDEDYYKDHIKAFEA